MQRIYGIGPEHPNHLGNKPKRKTQMVHASLTNWTMMMIAFHFHRSWRMYMFQAILYPQWYRNIKAKETPRNTSIITRLTCLWEKLRQHSNVRLSIWFWQGQLNYSTIVFQLAASKASPTLRMSSWITTWQAKRERPTFGGYRIWGNKPGKPWKAT